MLSTVLASSHEYLGGLRCCQHKTSSTETDFFLSELPTFFFLCVCVTFLVYKVFFYHTGEAVATSRYSWCPRTLLDWRHGRVDFQIFLAVSVGFFVFILSTHKQFQANVVTNDDAGNRPVYGFWRSAFHPQLYPKSPRSLTNYTRKYCSLLAISRQYIKNFTA